MAFPTPTVNVELGIADTIRAIKEVLAKPKDNLIKKQDETLARLHQQLDIILNIVTKLETLFIEILRGFRNNEILQDRNLLKAHLTQTRAFLESRELLPYLDTALGALEAAAFSPKFESEEFREMTNGLRDLRAKLHTFRRALGNSGQTGPGLLYLMQLCYLVDQFLANDSPADENIPKIAQEAFDTYDWSLSSDIRKLIGGVIINS